MGRDEELPKFSGSKAPAGGLFIPFSVCATCGAGASLFWQNTLFDSSGGSDKLDF